ncbi:hypothetical protein NVS55_26455 [Myxococcus stipitatus]|uniref:toxin-antitoxin system YwqK family antitoxin n=1 Tax=Myxococcus stipitatus TaxID=83455 RepID=UPI00314500EA
MKETMMSKRFAVLCVVAVATQALGEDATAMHEDRLECPVGAEQRVERGSEGNRTYCIKVGSTPQNRVLNGPFVAYWPNGQKHSVGQYKAGFRSGLWTFFDAKGVKTGETQFENNDYHGLRVEYYPNGAKKLEQSWVKGKREGVEASYSEDGRKVSEVRYAADKPIVAK